MTPHRCVVEAGPGVIRRLCCGTGEPAEARLAATVLDCIDDPVALVDGQPVAVTALWARLLRSAVCPDRLAAPGSVLIVHPSWWSAPRVELITRAANTLAGGVELRSRSQLLAGAAADTVVVEIAARLVAISAGPDAGIDAEPRTGPPDRVTEAVTRRVAALGRAGATAVLIDAAGGVDGAAALAELIAERLCAAVDLPVEVVDRTGLPGLAVAATSTETEPPPPQPVAADASRIRRIPALLAGAAVLIGGVAVLGARAGRTENTADMPAAATFLVEGRVALQVPAQWPVRRVTTGPGSARVEVVSPSDPQAVLHMTQSPVAGGTLSAAAESMRQAVRQANDAEGSDIFVDFEPSGTSAGRPAVTYRELRAGHDIDWTVLVDGVVRISIGCQHRRGDPGTVRAACEQAVRSARAVG